jgi:POT family proton-dependent oligopeptide transporter
MAKFQYMTAPPSITTMPKGFAYILSNEALERFSFYGTRCILTVFMTKYLLDKSGQSAVMTPEETKTYFHFFVAAVYFMPFVGSLLSDIWLGKYKTILIFSILYCFGFFTLAFDNTRTGLMLGLGLIAIGSGVIKPCISANVGDQFGQSNKNLIERAYSWFYFAINFGAFFSSILCPILLNKFGPKIAFGVPAVFMTLATFSYWLGRKKFVHIPAAGFGFIKETVSKEGLAAIGKLSILFFFISMFWSLFDQMDSAWVLQAEKMDRTIFGYELLPSQIVSINPLLIMCLAPLFTYLIYPSLSKIFKVTPLRKISIGLFVAAAVFAISALIETKISAGLRPSILWMLLAYVVLTSSEVMVSITCNEFSYTQAPKTMKSFINALFFLSITLGNVFTAVVNKVIQNADGTSKLAGPKYFWFFASMMGITAILFVFAAMKYKEKSYIQENAQK